MKRICLNIDVNSPTRPYVNKILNQKFPFCEEALYPFVDIYKRTDVTDVFFNIFCQISLPPSKYLTDVSCLEEFIDKNHVQDTFARSVRFFYDLYTKHNTDVYDVWIKRCRKNGQNPWLSFRMNDSHHLLLLFAENINTFSKDAMAKGWMLGEDYGWFKYCLDYQVPEVRSTLLSYIEEQLLRYDVYGIELDFMRDITVFKYLSADMKECTEILTDFMREVKKITQKIAKVHGHDIKICVRTIRDIKQANFFGFDLETWAKEGLVDIVTPTSRWTGGDSGIPVKQWQKLLPDVEIVPGMDIAVNYAQSRGLSFASTEVARGLSASFLSQGADGVYFYNYFLNPEEPASKVDEEDGVAHSFGKNLSILMDCKNLEKIYSEYPLRFPIIPQAGEGFVGAPAMWQPLPAKLSANEEKCFEITTGKLPKNNTVCLVIGANKSADELEVMLNGEKCTGWSEVDLRFLPGIGTQPFASVSAYTANYVSDETICKRCFVDTEKLTDLVQNIKIKSIGSDIKIEWIELYTF